MNSNQGIFTVTLDFELYWGIRDSLGIEQYKNNLQGVQKAIPQILRVFRESDIHATWATVGFIFFKDLADLNKNLPGRLPNYKKKELSPYQYIQNTPDLDPQYHFAPELIDLILDNKGQEIGTHTYSHYYCLEQGQSISEFEEDLYYAVQLAKRKGISIKSMVFPRNQWNEPYLAVLEKLGVQCYRGNASNWMYNASDEASQNIFQRAFRLIDTYINISGQNTFDLQESIRKQPYNFPASRFLRPYSARLAFLDGLRLSRIKKAMEDAAVNHRIFHLWWHPHNFGINLDKNIEFLEKVIDHFKLLKNKYGMISLNMGELCRFSGVNNGK
jgi:peptidoglycan/xylan/chitin deacetylase (PgdA/CDA1 family)